VLHPEVSIQITANIARSQEEAEKQARGEAVGLAAEAEEAPDAPDAFDPDPQPDVP
jgi:large subunit ribosomal protein L9